MRKLCFTNFRNAMSRQPYRNGHCKRAYELAELAAIPPGSALEERGGYPGSFDPGLLLL